LPLGLLLLFVAASTQRDAPASSTGGHPPAGNGAAPAGQAHPAGVGQPVRDGQLEFVLTSWRCGVDQVGRAPWARRPHGQFCLGDVTARNVGRQPRTLFERFEKLSDDGGNDYPADFGARFYVGGQTLWDAVTPGRSVRGTLVFDVPVDAHPAQLVLHDGPLSDGAAVPLP
jgi:hypothetical protein